MPFHFDPIKRRQTRVSARQFGPTHGSAPTNGSFHKERGHYFSTRAQSSSLISGVVRPMKKENRVLKATSRGPERGW